MQYKPHQYQEYATQKILDQAEAGLFLDLGLGKTVVTLTAISELLHDRFEVSRVLVIAPLRVAEHTWATEAAKWDHLRYLKISKVLGTQAERLQALNTRADIWIINRENVEWLVGFYGQDWPFDMVVIDELSSFKSTKAKRFRALRKVRPYIKRIVGLTGTPTPNGLMDLWPQIYLLDQGERLGKTVTGYRSRYFDPGKRNRETIFNWVPKEGAEAAIYGKLAELCISMRSSDWLQLPERINRTVVVEFPEQIRRVYQQLERDYILSFDDGDVTAANAAVLSGKLLQLANGAVYNETKGVQQVHDCKLKALYNLVEEANGHPVLVFYSFKHDLQRIQEMTRTWLQANDPEFQVRTLETAQDIEDWNAGGIDLLLAHPASAGHGLNLQAGGNIIIWYGLPWSLELYQQANARLDRQGQEKSVIVHHLVAEGTIDEDVMEALGRKEAGQDALLEAVKARVERVKGDAAA